MTTKRMTRIALCAALLAPCAWLSIPTQPPFTMQTFGVFLTLLLLGARDGAIAIALYILLGAMGAPVFSGFNGGMGALLGPTGGYIVGFLLICPIYGLLCRNKAGLWAKALALLLGLAGVLCLRHPLVRKGLRRHEGAHKRCLPPSPSAYSPSYCPTSPSWRWLCGQGKGWKNIGNKINIPRQSRGIFILYFINKTWRPPARAFRRAPLRLCLVPGPCARKTC